MPGFGGGGGQPVKGVGMAASAGPIVVVVVDRGTTDNPPVTRWECGVLPAEWDTPALRAPRTAATEATAKSRRTDRFYGWVSARIGECRRRSRLRLGVGAVFWDLPFS